MTVELLPSPPHKIGPTWQKTVDGDFYLPSATLAWDILAYAHKYIRSPGGPTAGEPFLPTNEQMRFLAWWYAVDDDGKFVYREGVFRRMKGAGKDPLAAVMALSELCFPTVFSHFDATGRAVGKSNPQAWVQVVAVSQDQSRNTFQLFPSMISKEMKKDFKMEINKFIVYAEGGRQLEAVTSSPTTIEGGRPTFVVKNETQWWQDNNGGHDMAGVIQGNVTKASFGGCRILAICNGHIPGMDSDAERDYEKWQKIQSGEIPDTRFLYDALEAPASTPTGAQIPPEQEDPEGHEQGLQALREGLLIARGDAVWLDVDGIIAEAFNTKTPVTEYRRKFLNQINAAEDSWIAPHEWDAREASVSLLHGEDIALGFDGSKSSDHTGLVACRISDGALFVLNHWVPKKHGGEVPRLDVDSAVRAAMKTYNVKSFRADVKEFEAYVDQWSRDYRKQLKILASPGNPVAYDMRGQAKNFSFDCESFLDAVLENELIHDGNRALRAHVTNAHRNGTQWDTVSIRKPSRGSSRKIDLAVCAVMAWGARQEVLMSKKYRTGGVAVFK